MRFQSAYTIMIDSWTDCLPFYTCCTGMFSGQCNFSASFSKPWWGWMQFFKMHFMISFQSLVCASINTFKHILGISWMKLCETLDMAAL